MRHRLLAFASLTEGLTGLSLLALPSIAARLLFGAEFIGTGVAAARVAGITLISLGVASWPTRDPRRAEHGMLLYTLLVAIYLMVIGLQGETVGVLLWPVAAYHAALAVAFVAVRKATPSGPHG